MPTNLYQLENGRVQGAKESHGIGFSLRIKYSTIDIITLSWYFYIGTNQEFMCKEISVFSQD